MSEPFIEYREEFNINDIARKYAERVARVIDEQTLANVENRLAEFGYVKVVRCRDCEHYYPHGVPTCQRNRECVTGYDINGDYGEWYDGEFYVEPDGFCAWGEQREGAES